jgi:hypothetical protein
MFIGKFGKKPMQFFGLWGSLAFFLGFTISMVLIISKLSNVEFSITNKPAFYIALTSMVIGTQLFLAGFIGELVSRSSPDRNAYNIEDKKGI